MMRRSLALLRLLFIGVTSLLWLCGCASPYAKAIVISESYAESNSGYPVLDTAHEDARKVETMLSKLNKKNKGRITLFDHVYSLNQSSLDEVVHQFQQSPPTPIALVYVAAHGFQSDRHTSFVGASGEPVNAEKFMSDIIHAARGMKEAKEVTGTIFLLDICRTPGKPSGLQPDATLLTEKDALVLFASSAGADDSGGYGLVGSPFARAIVAEFAKKQELRVSLRNIIDAVNGDTASVRKANATRSADATDADENGKPQNPWPYGLITFDVFLAGRSAWGDGT